MNGSAQYLGPSPKWLAAASLSHSATERQCWVEASPVGRTSSRPPDPLGVEGEVRGKNVHGLPAVIGGFTGGLRSWKGQVWNIGNKEISTRLDFCE